MSSAMKGAVPDGYMRDAQGRLVPIEVVKDWDKERDSLVREIIAKAKALQDAMLAFKHQAMGDIDAFVDLAAERYGVKIGGRKGNVTLTSYDGKFMIKVAQSDRLVFDERIQAAKALIDECIKEWTAGGSVKVRALVEYAFQTDKEGQINAGRMFSLMRLDIEDEKWKRAIQAIRDSIQIAATTAYLRAYERIGNTDRYNQIVLDMASI